MQRSHSIYFEVLSWINSLESSSNIEQLNHKTAYIEGALFISQYLLNESEIIYLDKLKENMYDHVINYMVS